MADERVRIFHSGEGDTTTAQTPGIERRELVSSPGAWVGLARRAPKLASGWHHHGDFDTYVYVISGAMKIEFGPSGQQAGQAGPGEVVHISQHTIHRESNPSDDEQVVFVVRVGQGPPVVNVDGPDE